MSARNVGYPGSIPGLGRSLGEGSDPLEKEMATHSNGGRSLVGYSPQGCKELDTTE